MSRGQGEDGDRARLVARAMPDGGSGAGPGGTSPYRLVLVILPLVVIVAAVANLTGLWTTQFQQAARDTRSRQAEQRGPDTRERTPADGAAGQAPARSDGGFDAAVVVSLIASASAEDGASVYRMCGACHPSEKNGPPRMGPSLWGIVGHRMAAQDGFNYSPALRARGGSWSYRDLAEYIHNPRTFAPGTSMAFIGISDNGRMASLLAYLRTLSDHPVPLPE